MANWQDVLLEAAVAGAGASLASAAVLAWAGHSETPSAAAPINAPSQWVWGSPEALSADGADRRHTLTGFLVHHFAATWWAAMHAAVLRDRREMAQPLPSLAAAGATTALAALVDLKLTPERFTPGFQRRLSPRALSGTYAAFALGLALGSLAVRRRR